MSANLTPVRHLPIVSLIAAAFLLSGCVSFNPVTKEVVTPDSYDDSRFTSANREDGGGGGGGY